MDVLLGKTLEELQEVALAVGLKKFAGKQLANWLYVKRVTSFDEMTNISLSAREQLKQSYRIGRHMPIAHVESKDGTKKYLFQVGNQYVESVYIPDAERATLCVSTQAGCKMGCKFCMTGTLGFQGHLSAADILNQTNEEKECFAMLTLISKEDKKETLLAVSVNVLKIQGGDSAPITLMTDYDREDTVCRLYIFFISSLEL